MESFGRAKKTAATLLGAVGCTLLAYAVYRLMFLGIDGLRLSFLFVFAGGLSIALAACTAVSAAVTEGEKRAVVRRAIWALFGFYLLCLIALVFVFRIEAGVSYAERKAYYQINWDTQTNFVPFDTVRRYVDAYSRGVIPKTSLLNLVGNVILMAPMAFFLPSLFPSMRKLWRFLIVMLSILLAVEAIQLVLCCGICDIDDVILNWVGAMIIYLILSLPPIAKLLTKLYIWQPGKASAAPAVAGPVPSAASGADKAEKTAEPIVGIDILGNIGLSALKTCVAVGLCLLIGRLLERESTCLLASVTAILCLRTTAADSIRTDLSRLFGAALGGLLGCALVIIGRNLPGYEERFFVLLLPCVLLFAIYLCNVLHIGGGMIVTLAAILLVGLQVGGSEGQGVHFAARRALDVLTGAGVAFLANTLLPPYPKKGPPPG